MNEIKNEPAFPVTSGSWHRPGISIRDYFAAKAMQACFVDDTNVHGTARLAYRIADAMLEARGGEESDMSEKHVQVSDKHRHEKGTSQENRHIAMRKTTRDEKIVNPGVYEVPEFECPRCGHCCPEREWVGLTDEDIDLYAFDIGVTDNKAPAWLVTYARGIEAKLKEKNT
jgi:hypothetical protein